MGGRGSGQWYRSSSRDTVEGTRFLDAGELRRKGVIIPGARTEGLWFWRDAETGAERASINYTCRTREARGELQLTYRTRSNGGPWREMQYSVQLVSVASNLGSGRLWYFLCPASGCIQRVKRLYCGGLYACRVCCGLVHESTRESHRAARLAIQLATAIGAEPADVEEWLRDQDADEQRFLYAAMGAIQASKSETKLLRRMGMA